MELRWTQEAAADLERITDYLFEHTPDHAERLVRALYEAPATLLMFPNRGRLGKKEGTRELVMSPLPYIVVSLCAEHDLCRPHPARSAAVAVTGRRAPRVQSGARRHGIVGLYGNGGNVESATYRI
jgi:toxin ParE1/3/4